jgi:NADH-quinone oxidoreductase subunit A
MPYESGKDPVGSARSRFSIKFYTVAVIFLLFDIEVLFIIPFAVAFKSLIAAENANAGVIAYGTIAFIEILIFISTLIVGYIYVWRKGTFDWGLQARAEARAEAKEMAREKRQRARELQRAA